MSVIGINFPIIVQETGNEEPPDGNPIWYELGKNGIFLHRDGVGLMHSCTLHHGIPVDKLPQLQTVQTWADMDVEMLPLELLLQVLNFFREVNKKQRSEAVVILYFNPTERLWRVEAPDQRGHGLAVDYGEVEQIEGYLPAGTIHSHCNIDAFHSSTDTHDEADFDGLHITLGHIDDNEPSLAMSIVANKERFPKQPAEYLEGVEPKKVRRRVKKATTYAATPNYSGRGQQGWQGQGWTGGTSATRTTGSRTTGGRRGRSSKSTGGLRGKLLGALRWFVSQGNPATAEPEAAEAVEDAGDEQVGDAGVEEDTVETNLENNDPVDIGYECSDCHQLATAEDDECTSCGGDVVEYVEEPAAEDDVEDDEESVDAESVEDEDEVEVAAEDDVEEDNESDADVDADEDSVGAESVDDDEDSWDEEPSVDESVDADADEEEAEDADDEEDGFLSIDDDIDADDAEDEDDVEDDESDADAEEDSDEDDESNTESDEEVEDEGSVDADDADVEEEDGESDVEESADAESDDTEADTDAEEDSDEDEESDPEFKVGDRVKIRTDVDEPANGWQDLGKTRRAWYGEVTELADDALIVKFGYSKNVFIINLMPDEIELINKPAAFKAGDRVRLQTKVTVPTYGWQKLYYANRHKVGTVKSVSSSGVYVEFFTNATTFRARSEELEIVTGAAAQAKTGKWEAGTYSYTNRKGVQFALPAGTKIADYPFPPEWMDKVIRPAANTATKGSKVAVAATGTTTPSNGGTQVTPVAAGSAAEVLDYEEYLDTNVAPVNHEATWCFTCQTYKNQCSCQPAQTEAGDELDEIIDRHAEDELSEGVEDATEAALVGDDADGEVVTEIEEAWEDSQVADADPASVEIDEPSASPDKDVQILEEPELSSADADGEGDDAADTTDGGVGDESVDLTSTSDVAAKPAPEPRRTSRRGGAAPRSL